MTARLDWNEVNEPDHASMLGLYTRLIALRANEPELSDSDLAAVTVDYNDQARWLILNRGNPRIAINFADTPQIVPLQVGEPRGEWKVR